ncbi:MAG: AEC family transporter [Ruminococcus sp.]|nr:AEC family transporter [Ruminococcus sp.]
MATIILKQAILMLLLNLVGMIAYRAKIVDKNGGRQFSNFVLEIVTPVLVVNAYAEVDYDPKLVWNLLWTFLLAAISYGIAIAAVTLFIRKKPERETSIERFSAIYSNCGFMGIPLASALLGNIGVFYCSAYLTIFFCFAWTHGIMMLTGQHDKKALIKKLTSPTMIGIVIGLLLFFFQIDLPEVLQSTFDYISGLNTPMAMVASGISVAQAKIWQALKNPRVYYVSAVKLIILPLILMVLFLPLQFIPLEIRTVVLVLSAAPSAAMCTLQCQKFGKNDSYAAHIFAVSTIASTATMPLIVKLFTTLASYI